MADGATTTSRSVAAEHQERESMREQAELVTEMIPLRHAARALPLSFDE